MGIHQKAVLQVSRKLPLCRVCAEKPRYELLDKNLDIFHLCSKHFICFEQDEVRTINVYIPQVQERMFA